MGIDIFTSRPISLTFDAGEKKLKLRTCAVVVSNNDFEDVVSLGLKRASVDKGVIALFITKYQSGWGFLNQIARSLLFGRFKDDPNLIKMLLKEVRISSPSGKITASVDGEIREMTSPLHFAIKPGALKVIVPRSR
jgi:Sphingosine kinase and enzymes related to eukaryotic diacylglycerol kinase